MAEDLNTRTRRENNDKIKEEVINRNWERINEVCEINNLKITNGFYCQKDIHKSTWKQGRRDLRATTDYFIVKIRTSITIKDVWVIRGTEYGTNHKLNVPRIKFLWVSNQHKNKTEISLAV